MEGALGILSGHRCLRLSKRWVAEDSVERKRWGAEDLVAAKCHCEVGVGPGPFHSQNEWSEILYNNLTNLATIMQNHVTSCTSHWNSNDIMDNVCHSQLPLLGIQPKYTLSVSATVRPSVQPSVCPSACPSDRPSVRAPVRPTFCVSVGLSVRPSVRPSVLSSAPPFVCPDVCPGRPEAN
jgi:hypothetical protein